MPWIEQQLIADGVTAEGRVVVNKALLEMITNDQVLTLAVNAGGTGYVVGEIFDIVGGTALAVNGVGRRGFSDRDIELRRLLGRPDANRRRDDQRQPRRQRRPNGRHYDANRTMDAGRKRLR